MCLLMIHSPHQASRSAITVMRSTAGLLNLTAGGGHQSRVEIRLTVRHSRGTLSKTNNMRGLIIGFVLAQFSVGLCCDPGPLIEKHEGRKPCVYLDTKGIKTIGVGYNMQNKGAADVFKSIGADYQKFASGLTTPWNVKCDCTKVPCLSDEQIDELFSLSLRTAVSDAEVVIPSFPSLCCSMQDVLVDMAFTLGRERLARLTRFAQLISRQAWRAAADELAPSEWCATDDTGRCADAAAAVAVGCGCAEPTPQACDAQGSFCCPPASSATCCKGEQSIPKGDQYQISSAASPKILHHTV